MKRLELDLPSPFFAFIADLHIGNHQRMGGSSHCGMNERCLSHIEALKDAVDSALERGAECLVILGDVFDSIKPRPQMIAAVQQILEEIPTIVLVGNHDYNSDETDDHAVAPLRPVATVIDEPTIVTVCDQELWLVPYMSRSKGAVNDWLPKLLRDGFKKHSTQPGAILGMHMGIKDEKTPPWLAKSTSAVDADDLANWCQLAGAALAISGDWHSHRSWGDYVIQCGALVPTGWDNPGTKGYGSVYMVNKEEDDLALFREEIPGPRFVKLLSTDNLPLPGLLERTKLYAEFTVPMDRLEVERAQMTELIDSGDLYAGEVLPDKELIELDSQEAAKRVRGAASISAASEEFVEGMALEDDSLREAIAARLGEYLR